MPGQYFFSELASRSFVNNEFGVVFHKYAASNGDTKSLLRTLLLHKLDFKNRAQIMAKLQDILHRNGVMLELIKWIQSKVRGTHSPAQNENRIRVR